MNLWDMFKASKGIPVSDPMARLWGYQYQQKHGVSEISGVPPLHFTSRVEHLLDYHIYGNTVQDGTPTPENPVEVQGCGEYDSELNGYKISVTVSDGGNAVTTPVYIGSEPLHKIGDYADYVDYKRGVVVRRIKKLALTGEGHFYKNYTESTNYLYYAKKIDVFPGSVAIASLFCNKLPVKPEPPMSVIGINVNNGFSVVYFNFGAEIMNAQPSGNTVKGLKKYLADQYTAGTPVTVWYVLAEREEELLENLLPIQTIKGTNILTADTTVQPSEMYIKGKIKPIGGNEND